MPMHHCSQQVTALLHVLKHNHETNRALLNQTGRAREAPVKAVVFSQVSVCVSLCVCVLQL